MREHISNALYGALDYIAYPAGMLLLAPFILRTMGVERFGIWAMANAVLMTEAILASGFGDANIRVIAQARGRHAIEQVTASVRSAMGIHLVLGAIIAAVGWTAAEWLARSTVNAHVEQLSDACWALRLAALIAFIRALETVCVSTQRAFSRYGVAIQVSVIARVSSLVLAGVIPLFYKSVSAVMVAALFVSVAALAVQMKQVKSLLGIRRLTPAINRTITRSLLAFGVFTWIQGIAGLFAGQADRLVAGAALGASALAVYTFCVQLTQPIYGITAAGLHFVFPMLATDSVNGDAKRLRTKIGIVAASNVVFVGASLAGLLLFGEPILRLWAGSSIATAASQVLPVVAWGSSLAAVSVTGNYALLALGRPKVATTLTAAGGIFMIAALFLMVPRFGLQGVAFSRLIPGCTAVLIYIPLYRYVARSDLDLTSV